MRSAKNDKARGHADTIVGRAMDAVGRLTGRKKTRATGKAARVRGASRRLKGRAKTKSKRR